jgi:hypothetical protein
VLVGILGLAACGILSLKLKSLNVICISFLCLLTCFYVSFNITSYHWYYAPYYILAYFYAGAGASWLIRRFRAIPNRWLFATGTACVCAFVLFLICRNFILARERNQSYGRREDYFQIAGWMDANTPATAQLAAAEIGTLGWYTRRPIVDLCGLVSPSIAKAYRNRDVASFYSFHSPEYVLVHEPMFPLERGIGGLVEEGEYVLAKRFEFSPGTVFSLYVKRDVKPGPGDS